MLNTNELLQQIKDMRVQLVLLAKRKGTLTDAHVLEISQNLDKLIIQYYQLTGSILVLVP